MAQESWPSPGHNSRAVTDSEYETVASRFSDDGVYGSPTDSQVVTAGAGLTVNVRANVSASVRGHAWTSGSTGATLTVGANSSGQTRTDRVVLRLDRSAWTVRAVVKAGTPGSAAPPLTRDTGDTGMWEVLLATVTVRTGAVSVSVVRDELYVGTRVRPSLASHLNPYPEQGEMAYETDTGHLRSWDGSAWRSVYQRSAAVVIDSPNSAWSVGTSSVIEMRSGNVHLRLGSWTRRAGNLASGGPSRLPVQIPAQFRHPNRDQYVLAHVTGNGLARLQIYSSTTDTPGQVWLQQHPGVSTGQNILSSSGTSWVVD